MRQLLINIRDKDFASCRQWAVENADIAQDSIIEAFYEMMDEFVSPPSTPAFVATLAEHDYRGSLSTYKIVWLLAMCRDLMKNTTFNGTI